VTDAVRFTIDGVQISALPGQTILQAADAAGVYIPRLCNCPELAPYGSCRVCTVMANARPQAACTTPVSNGMVVESNSERVNAIRRDIIDMLFVEGNHFCMFCEKSGNCELQATAYRLGIPVPRFPYQYPQRPVDATHPDVLIDHNRCILCARCVRASKELDGKYVFEFVGRGRNRRIGTNSRGGLGQSDLTVSDRAVDVCPVGAILRKGVGFAVPVGQRLYDQQPIGSELEARRRAE
jgi:[NiFe] hydrogenase diaphorase moiety small subunit